MRWSGVNYGKVTALGNEERTEKNQHFILENSEKHSSVL